MPLRSAEKVSLIPALVCAGICVILIKTGFLTLFFLVPLGLCSIVYGTSTAWFSFVLAIVGNGIISVGVSLRGVTAGSEGAELANAGIGALYFAILALCFTWIMAGNPPASRLVPGLPRIRNVYRFIAASTFGAAMFLIITFRQDKGFSILNRPLIEAILSTYINAYRADAAQQAFLERILTPDRIIEELTAMVLRGGAVVSGFFLFFFSRQIALIVARLFRRLSGNPSIHPHSDLIGFVVPRRAIWVLSLCLPVILLCRVVSLDIIEIAAWNVLIICAIMFLAQGGGIVLFNLTRRPMSFFLRLLFSFLFLFLLFSPGINVLAAGLLILLGIAETWLPLRKGEKINE